MKDKKIPSLSDVVIPYGKLYFDREFFIDENTLWLLFSIKGFGWQDASYKNDTCPSFELTNENNETFKLWIDHPNPKIREVDTGYRFTIYKEDKKNDMWEEVPLFESDNQKDLLNFIITKKLSISKDQLNHAKNSLRRLYELCRLLLY